MYRKLLKWFGKKKKKTGKEKIDFTTTYPSYYEQDGTSSPKCKPPLQGVVYPSRTKSFRSILKEPVYAVQARAICDYNVHKDSQALSFQKGDLITVLEQPEDGKWKGIIFGDRKKGGSRSGYFPASTVNLLGKTERRTLGSGKVKKVLPPTVPELNLKNPQQRNSAASSGYSSASSGSGSSDNRSSLGSDSFPLPPSPVSLTPGIVDGGGWSGYDTAPRGHPTPTCCSCVSTYSSTSAYKARNTYMAPTYVKIPSPVDSGLDLLQIRSEDSPIETCHSMTSLDSGRASGGYWDVVPSSSHSAHSSPRASASYTSSTASTISLEERVTEGDVRKLLVEQGVPDEEVLLMWLKGLHLPHLTPLFVTAGYDLPTIALMSPQDLSAVGVTDPAARKRLKERIGRLRLPDPVPNYIPDTLEEWLSALNLLEYMESLQSQGYVRVEDVTDLTWEDLEDIGITKLGHQKKIMLAIKRVCDFLSGKRVQRHHRQQELPNVQEVLITPHHPHTPLPLNSMGGSAGESVGVEMQTFRQCFLNPIGHYATLRPVRRRRSSDSTCHQSSEDQWAIHLVDPDPLRCRKYPANGTLPRRKPVAKIQPASKIVQDKYDLMCSEDLNKNNIYISDEPRKTNPKFQKCLSVPNEPLFNQSQYKQYERSNSFSSYGYTRNFWNSAVNDALPPPPPAQDLHGVNGEEFPPPPSQADLEKLHDPRVQSTESLCSNNNNRTNNVQVMESPKKSVEHAPPLAELASHPLFRQRRHDSTASNKSSSSTDSCDSLPFAKENQGTLKSKSKSGESSPTEGLPPVSSRPPACPKNSPSAKIILRRNTKSRSDDVLEEIGSMLSDLSSELDAMIVTEQKKETHV